MKKIIVYLHNNLADWEASFVLPYLREAQFQIQSVTADGQPVTTWGGLKLMPDGALRDVNWHEVALLILPGGETWSNDQMHQEILSQLPRLKKEGKPIAAICAATTAMARIGLLDDIKHTSSFLKFMKHFAPNYKGEHLYTEDLAVTDGSVITASGQGALEFSREILKLLKVYDDKKANEWYEFFKSNTMPPDWIP